MVFAEVSIPDTVVYTFVFFIMAHAIALGGWLININVKVNRMALKQDVLEKRMDSNERLAAEQRSKVEQIYTTVAVVAAQVTNIADDIKDIKRMQEKTHE